MGNITLSSINKPPISELSDYIDKLASEYILNMDIKNLSRMSNKQYCDKLVVLTGDILSKKFDHAEIAVLKKRTDGTYDNETTKEKVYFLDNDKLNDLDKTSMCRDIAKFYRDDIESQPNEAAKKNRLCELNVAVQVTHVRESPALQAAGAHAVKVHGWIYGLNDGCIRDLTPMVDSVRALEPSSRFKS